MSDRIRTRKFYRENEDCVIVTYTQSPYFAAQTSGPPERCYQAYGGEVEVISVKLENGEDDFMDSSEEDAWITDIMENPDADFGPDADDLRDAAIDRALSEEQGQ
jgi:hypothetical protein